MILSVTLNQTRKSAKNELDFTNNVAVMNKGRPFQAHLLSILTYNYKVKNRNSKKTNKRNPGIKHISFNVVV